jgi:hypothetical protein
MHALSGANKVEELGATNHGADLSHVGAMSASCCQRSTYLGAKICGAEQCYLGVTICGAEKRVKNDIKIF